MEEIQLALMQDPLNQINSFSQQGLQHISQAFKVNHEYDVSFKKKQSMQFDGKLHLDLKIDKILLKIQSCKIQLAELLEMHLPYQDNYIQIKNIQLSTLKPSSQSQKQKQSEYKQERQSKQIQNSKNILNTNNMQFKVEQQNKQQLQNKEIKKIQEKTQQKLQKIIKQEQKKADQLNEQIKQVIQSQIKEQNQQKESVDNFINQIHKQITNFKKTIMLRQAQLGMIIFILQSRKNPSFQKDYKQNYEQLKKYVIPADKIYQHINVYILEEFFDIQQEYYGNYQKIIAQIKEKMKQYEQFINENQRQSRSSILSTFTSKSPEILLQKILKCTYKLKIINSKIITMAQVFPYACIKDKNDLFSFNKSHERWQKLISKDLIKFKFFGQNSKVRKSFQTLKNNMNILNASMNIFNQNKSLSVLNMKNWGKLYQASSKILKVALFKSDAQYQASVMISQPDSKLTKQIWNLPQQKVFKNFVSACLPSIEFSEQLYLPRIFQQFLKANGKINFPQGLLINHIIQYGNQLYQKAPYQKKISIRINAKHRISRRYQIKTKNQQQKQQPPKPQSYSKKIFTSINQMTTSLTNFFKKGSLNSSTAILHIHGGGFISMSSFIHQTYTRIWANQLGVPIISVDYGKAPQFPYPLGLYDCFQAYMWTRYIFRQIYNTQVQKVLIVGDSAGGNLAAALTNLLIQWNLQKPDGLVLVYPALNLNFDNYTPSLLSSLNDMILPHTFLKICLNAYLKDAKQSPKQSQLLSPIVTSQSVLAKYPKIKMFVGSKDPFHDDCCRFVQKINDCNPMAAQLTIFEQFPHGFLQFDLKTNPHQQARKATKQVQNALSQFLQQQK